MNKRLLFVVAFIVIAGVGFWLYAQGGQGAKSGWKVCTGLPLNFPATKDPITGQWRAVMTNVHPSNPPCYVDITAVATGDKSEVQASTPIRIYIKK